MKIALITGGSRGLGKSMCLHLAQKGYDIIFTYKNAQTEAENLVTMIEAKGGKAIALQLDVTQIDTFKSFTDTLTAVLETNFNVKRGVKFCSFF